MALMALALVAMMATQAKVATDEEALTPAQEAGVAYWKALESDLRQSSSPRERALSARIAIDGDRVAAGKALREASQSAPGDVLVQMLWTSAGQQWSGCDTVDSCPGQALAWARVEPDNGFAWMPAFEALGDTADAASIDAGIARIAGAKRFDDHFVEYWQAYRAAIAARPIPEIALAQLRQPGAGKARAVRDIREEAISIAAMAHAAALPVRMQGLARACKRSNHPEVAQTRFEDCARIGRGIVDSDSSGLSKLLGSALVRVSGLQDEADRKARRALEWRQHSMTSAGQDGSHAAYFADLASTGSEQRAQELAMARHGIPLDPPADWKGAWE